MDGEVKLPILSSAYSGLTKGEKVIADYIMENASNIMEQTISDLAANTGKSEITVSRFCKKLGYSGLQSLKIALAADMSAAGEEEYSNIQSDDSYEAITKKLFKNIEDGLQDTIKLLDFKAIENAVEKIVAAGRVAVYGFGNSATVCRDIETRFLRFGIPVQAYSDAHQQVTSASLLTEEDVVIAVSHTGATLELLETVRIAKKNGATIIVITSYAKPPLVKLADIALHGMGREVHYMSEAVASRLIHMAITDVLYTGITRIMPETYKMNIRRMRSVIAEKRV